MAFADEVVTHYITWVWLGDSHYGLFQTLPPEEPHDQLVDLHPLAVPLLGAVPLG